MLFDGIKLLEGSEILNATIAVGSEFPTDPNVGELFYINSAGTHQIGLYNYSPAGQWVRMLLEGEGGSPDALLRTGDSLAGILAAPTGTKFTQADAPSAGIDLTNKNYVDGLIAGLSWKNSVKAKTTANTSLSGTQTIDGVSLVAGDRVLVASQTVGAQNGIYVVASGAWSRANDADTAAELSGSGVWVTQGTTNGDTGWVCTTDNITLGTTSIAFAQFNGSGAVTAGTGLSLSGNTLNVSLGAGIGQLPTNEVGIDIFTNGGLVLTADGTNPSTATGAQLALAPSGVTAGTYSMVNASAQPRQLIIDAKGRITGLSTGTAITLPWTSITNTPTTLAGYGITDGAGGGSDLQSAYDFVSNAANIITNTTNPTLTLKQGVGVGASTNVLQIRNSSNSIVFAVNANGIISGQYNGNAATATSASTAGNITGGSAGNIPYQIAGGSTGFVGNGTSGQYLKSNANSAPSWNSITYAELTSKPTTLTGFGITDALGLAGGTMTGNIVLNNNNITGIKNATFSTPGVLSTTTGAVAVNWSTSQNYKQNEPTGAITYTFTAPAGPCHLQLYIDSDGTSTAQTFTWPASVIWFGSQWTGANNKKAIINFWYDGTNYLAMGVNQV